MSRQRRSSNGDTSCASLSADPWRGNKGIGLPRLRAFLAVRSRIAEDCLAEAVAFGVRQYIVLGAGLDTFACRNPFPELRVFEVDHPRTQRWKLGRLRAAGLTAPAQTAYVPVDFEDQSIARQLADHGFDAAGPTAVSWLGVVPYLDERTVWATLEWVAGIVGDGGHIVFDYGSRPRWWQLGQHLALRRLAARVAAAGEPFRTRLQPAYLKDRLTSIGFTAVADLDSRELNRRYFARRGRWSPGWWQRPRGHCIDVEAVAHLTRGLQAARGSRQACQPGARL